jgi:malonyl-CoA O-methyltransferase
VSAKNGIRDRKEMENRTGCFLTAPKERIAHCFRQAMATYNDHATVQRQVGSRLLALTDEFSEISYERVLEIGCCTGLLSRMLCLHKPVVTLFLNDLVADFLPQVASGLPERHRPLVRPCFGDIETIPLPPDLSLIISSSSLQWMTDLPRLFQTLSRSLQAGGFLVFSLFGPGTLAEFRALTGIGLEYRRAEDLAAMLGQDFIVERALEERIPLLLPNPLALLHHLRATGAGGVRDYRWTKTGLKRFEQEYQARFSTDGGVVASFVALYFVVRKT